MYERMKKASSVPGFQFSVDDDGDLVVIYMKKRVAKRFLDQVGNMSGLDPASFLHRFWDDLYSHVSRMKKKRG